MTVAIIQRYTNLKEKNKTIIQCRFLGSNPISFTEILFSINKNKVALHRIMLMVATLMSDW